MRSAGRQRRDHVIEHAARFTDIGLDAARNAIRPGVTELEVWGEIMGAMGRAGGENPAITLPVLSGPKANTGHSLASRKKIMAGEVDDGSRLRVSTDEQGVVFEVNAQGEKDNPVLEAV